MDKQRLQELAGICAENLSEMKEEELGDFVELDEALKPANEEKGFTTTEIKDHYGHVVDIILHMAKADAEGDQDAFEDNVEAYFDAACDEMKDMLKQKVK